MTLKTSHVPVRYADVLMYVVYPLCLYGIGNVFVGHVLYYDFFLDVEMYQTSL